jgi:hypothetical protein
LFSHVVVGLLGCGSYGNVCFRVYIIQHYIVFCKVYKKPPCRLGLQGRWLERVVTLQE